MRSEASPSRFPFSLIARLRNIQDRNVFVSVREQIVNQRGLASTNIDDCRVPRCDSFDERQRGFSVWTIPTYGGGGLLGIDFFPMVLSIHGRSPANGWRSL